MKPLDFVKTPKGAIAMITEVQLPDGNISWHQCSISFLGGGNPTQEKNAWWTEDDGLILIDNLPSLLARNLAHPFSSHKEDATLIYPIR